MNSDTKTRAQTGYELMSPKKLLERNDLTRDQKAEVLRQWELDLSEEMVTEEENMPAAAPGEAPEAGDPAAGPPSRTARNRHAAPGLPAFVRDDRNGRTRIAVGPFPG